MASYFPAAECWTRDTGEIRMYYGGADRCLALATAQLSDVLSYVQFYSAPPLRKRMGVAVIESSGTLGLGEMTRCKTQISASRPHRGFNS